MNSDIEIFGNVFQFNQGLFMVCFYCEYFYLFMLIFFRNLFFNNMEVLFWLLFCEVSILGFMDYRVIVINYNIFNSNFFLKEFCVNIYVVLYRSMLLVLLNFWGYEEEVKIKQRIFDVEDNYEFILVGFCFFFNSVGNVVKNLSICNILNVFVENYLGGCIFYSIELKKNQSFFIVLLDIIVLLNVLFIVDLGVELQFKLGVGMLVLGLFFVCGVKDILVLFFGWKEN